jgi:zinc transporter
LAFGHDIDRLPFLLGKDDIARQLRAISSQHGQIQHPPLSPQRDALDRLYRQPGDFLTDREAQDLREETDRLTRHLEDLDLARERALVTQEELQNRVAQEQNQRVYLLSVVAAIFLPLTFVTGLLGMNVAGLPGTESRWSFAISAVMMVLLGVGLTLFFKRKRWI